MAVRQLVFPVAQLIMQDPKPDTVWSFFGGLYAYQKKFDSGELWNKTFVDGKVFYSDNFAVQGLFYEAIQSAPRQPIAPNWAEFQVMMNDLYAMTEATQFLPTDSVLKALYVQRAGLYKPTVTNQIKASDNTVLATGITTPAVYADKWNTLLIPYERNLGNEVEYITPLLGSQNTWWFRKTHFVNNYFSGLYY